MWACYMQLALDSQCWFTFRSSSACLDSAYWVNQRDSSGRVSFGSDYTHVVHDVSGRRPASFT
ncbi:hypothetical protein M405DRAFT_826388, partial [Rhizopogon salebrosus TDB-379]